MSRARVLRDYNDRHCLGVEPLRPQVLAPGVGGEDLDVTDSYRSFFCKRFPIIWCGDIELRVYADEAVSG